MCTIETKRTLQEYKALKKATMENMKKDKLAR